MGWERPFLTSDGGSQATEGQPGNRRPYSGRREDGARFRRPFPFDRWYRGGPNGSGAAPPGPWLTGGTKGEVSESHRPTLIAEPFGPLALTFRVVVRFVPARGNRRLDIGPAGFLSADRPGDGRRNRLGEVY